MVLVNDSASDPTELVSSLDRVWTDDGGDSPIVVLAFEHSSDEILRAWRSTSERLPDDLTLVSVGEITRSTTADSDVLDVGAARVLPVGADDLTGIDLAVSRALSEFDESGEPVIWIDSVAPLVSSTGLEQAFRFLHIFSGRVNRANGTAFCRFDPTAHESPTAAAIEPLFDETIELE